MEVTRSTFRETLPLIEEAIQESVCLAFDLELTGLDSNQRERANILDTVGERYLKIKNSAESFLPIQFGLSAFCWDEKQDAFIAKTFNFYIFPEPLLRGRINDRRFLCQTSSIQFLASCRFNFNKLFHDGISFLSKKQETIYREMLNKNEAKQNETQSLPTETPSNPLNTMQLLEETIAIHVGFRSVLDLISKSGKILLGHNMFLDCMHLYHSFIEYLPSEYALFKEELHKNFPNIIDTKYIASREKMACLFENTSLGEVARRVNEEPFCGPKIIHHPDFLRYQNLDNMHHEAGYDAYITGVSFLRLIHHWCSLQEIKTPLHLLLAGSASNQEDEDEDTKDILSSFRNRIFAMRSIYECFSLCGQEIIPQKPNAFYIFDFPTEWKTQDIKDLFVEFGDVYVQWGDDSSAVVNIAIEEDPDAPSRVLPSFEMNPPCKIISFDKFIAEKHGKVSANQDVTSPKRRKLK